MHALHMDYVIPSERRSRNGPRKRSKTLLPAWVWERDYHKGSAGGSRNNCQEVFFKRLAGSSQNKGVSHRSRSFLVSPFLHPREKVWDSCTSGLSQWSIQNARCSHNKVTVRRVCTAATYVSIRTFFASRAECWCSKRGTRSGRFDKVIAVTIILSRGLELYPLLLQNKCHRIEVDHCTLPN